MIQSTNHFLLIMSIREKTFTIPLGHCYMASGNHRVNDCGCKVQSVVADAYLRLVKPKKNSDMQKQVVSFSALRFSQMHSYQIQPTSNQHKRFRIFSDNKCRLLGDVFTFQIASHIMKKKKKLHIIALIASGKFANCFHTSVRLFIYTNRQFQLRT